MKRLTAAIVILFSTVGYSSAQGLFPGTDPNFPDPVGSPEILLESERLIEVWNEGCMLTEGVAAGLDGYVYFSDVTFTKFCFDKTGMLPRAGDIWRHDPASGETTVFRSPSGMSAGMKFDANGDMILTMGADHGLRMLTKIDMESGKAHILAGGFDGQPFNAPNDLTIDAAGRIYFTDPRYLGHETIEQPGYAVYRRDTDGTVDRIATDAGKPNGILVSPDQSKLYVVSKDNGVEDFMRLTADDQAPMFGPQMLLAYDLNEDGTLGPKRVLVDYAPCDGPDGITGDKAGNIYVTETCPDRLGVSVRQPDGTEIAFISTGDVGPTNVAFGKDDLKNVLFVTAGSGLYRIVLNAEGYAQATPLKE